MSDNFNEENVPEVYTDDEFMIIDNHISAFFGQISNVFHEIVSPDIHVDICVINPTTERNYYTFVTMGMGAHRMPIPEKLREAKIDRAELLITLPPTWEIQNTDEKWFWPIRWLKVLARLPGQQNAWYAYGHTVSNGGPFAENTELCGAMLTFPYSFDPPAFRCTMPDGSNVVFYQVLPLYENEMNYKLENDAEALEELFPEDYDMVVDITRENVLEDE